MAQQAGTPLKNPGPKDPVENDDNRRLTDEEQKEANLLKWLAAHRDVDRSIEELMVAVRGLKKNRTKLRSEIKNGGFMLSLIDEQLEEDNTSRRDRDARETQRAFIRTICGSPVGAPPKDLADEAERDEESWARDGYMTGLSGREGKPPKEMPPEFLKRWMGEWHRGDDRLNWAMAEEGINIEKALSSSTGPTAKEIASQPEDTPDADDQPQQSAEQLEDGVV